VVWVGDGKLKLVAFAACLPGLGPTLVLITTKSAFCEVHVSVMD
jgi:hypothetical protein